MLREHSDICGFFRAPPAATNVETESSASMITDEKGLILEVNTAAQALFGYPAAELLGEPISCVLPAAFNGDHSLLPMKRSPGDKRVLAAPMRPLCGQHRNGSRLDLCVCVSTVLLGEQRLKLRVYHVRARGQLKHTDGHPLVTHDLLTHCLNRIALYDRLHEEIYWASVHQQKLELAFIGLDALKLVNAKYGHAMGDRVLVGVADNLRRCLAGKGLLARVGGDEFVVLVRHPGPKQSALRLGERLLDCLQTPLQIGGRAITVRASLGLSIFSGRPDNVKSAADQLLSDACFAMCQAKKTGGGRVLSFNSLHREHVLHERLRDAIESQSLHLHYQPQFELEDPQRIIGIEALLRWDDGRDGQVSPDVFLPLAEQSGLMPALDAWVLERACRDNLKLINSGSLDVPVAVNISGHSFMQRDFIENIRVILEHSGLPANRLEVEVTETSELKDIAQARENALQLRAMGVHVSIDDFGTGYSSPSILRAIPFEKLKIDRSFVGEIESSPVDRAIVRGCLLIAESLCIKVVAEGVETREQLNSLLAHGCKFGQGFWFCHPLPLARLQKFITKVRAPSKLL